MTTTEIHAHRLFPTLVAVCRHANDEHTELIAAQSFGHAGDVQEARDAILHAERSAVMLADRIARQDRRQRVAVLIAAYTAS